MKIVRIVFYADVDPAVFRVRSISSGALHRNLVLYGAVDQDGGQTEQILIPLDRVLSVAIETEKEA